MFVSSLSYNTTWEELKDFFRQAGNVAYATVSERPDGSSKGCGIVQFETVEEAQVRLHARCRPAHYSPEASCS